MDLYAYAQIGNLEAIAAANGIDVPRLRGYRLMSEQEPLTTHEMLEIERDLVTEVYRRGCCSIPRFDPDSCMSEYSSETRQIEKHYITTDGEFRWELLHGKPRRRMKLAVRKMKKAVRAENEAWNRYAGREDVLYIHTRIGGRNWTEYNGDELRKQPWFLEKVDDAFDETYCSIYARIDPSLCRADNLSEEPQSPVGPSI